MDILKINKEKLYNIIETKILQTANFSAIDNIQREIVGVGKFSVVEFNNIKSGQIKLKDLEDAELYWILESAHNYINAIKAPEYYFEDAEIERYKFYEREDDAKIEYPLIFSNVTKLTKNQYAFPCSVGEIARLKYNNILVIRPELQREGRKDKYGYVKINTNPKRVRELCKLYEEKEYAFNGIRFNLMDDGESEFEYDEDERKIIINKGTIIIPDGNHRALATELVDPQKSCIEDNFIIFFTFFNVSKVKQTISQEWNVQPVNKRKISAMKDSRSNKIVESLKRNPTTDTIYSNKIVDTGREIQCDDGFILYDVLSGAIDKYYSAEELETQDEIAEVAEWLSIFLNRLTALLLDDFKNYKTIKRTKWSVDPYAFVGYIMLSKHLYKQEGWRDKLKIIIESIDFNNDNSPLINRTAKSKEKTIENYFKEVVENERVL